MVLKLKEKRRRFDEFYPLEIHGLRLGSGITSAQRLANGLALVAGFDKAVELNIPARLPLGVVEFDWAYTADSNNWYTPAGDFTVEGWGMDFSTLRWVRSSDPDQACTFNLDSRTTPRRFVLRDFAIEGPSAKKCMYNNGSFDDPLSYWYDYPIIRHYGAYSSSAPVDYVTLERLRVDAVNGYRNILFSGDGNSKIRVNGCDFRIAGGPLDLYGAISTSKSCDVYATYFRHSTTQTYSTNPSRGGTGHHCYIHPNIDVSFRCCDFGRNYQYCVQHYSASGSGQPNRSNLYYGCTVSRGSARGIMTNQESPTTIQACQFSGPVGNGAVQLQNSAIVSGCLFIDGGLGQFRPSLNDVYVVNNCRFELTETQVVNATPILLALQCKSAEISDCSFQGFSVGVTFNGAGAQQSGIVENCRIVGSGSSAICDVSNGTVVVSDCTTAGTAGGVSMSGAALYAANARVEGCAFGGSGSGLIIGSDTAPNQLRASANEYGTASLLRGAGTNVAQGVAPTERVHPTALTAAGGVVTLVPGANVFHVSAGTVDTMLFGANARTNAMMAGAVTLILDGAVTFTTAGNIKPGVTTSRAAGAAYRFTWDPNAGFWFERK